MYAIQQILDRLGGIRPGHTLPRSFYRDMDVYEFELENVFSRGWLLLGMESELPEVGSYLALTIGSSPILVIREKDGSIRGFHNICRHRGARLCSEGVGRLTRIVCPYHKWTYDTDGRLLAAPNASPDLERDSHGLVPLRIEVLEGCIYGALSSAAPDFEPFRVAAAPFLSSYGLTRTKVAYQSELIEKANWKLVMENARECYHCAASHPELKVSFPVSFGSGFRVTDGSRQDSFVAAMRQAGLLVGPREGLWWHVGRYPLNPGVASVSRSGASIVSKKLLPDMPGELGGLRWATEPNVFCHAFEDYAFIFSAFPISPQETRVVAKWLVAADAVEGVDYDLAELIYVWTQTNLEDRALAENNQLGVNGIGYRLGPYMPVEELVLRFNRWYVDAATRAARELCGLADEPARSAAHSLA